MNLIPLTPTIGAEVRDVDLTTELGPPTIDGLKAAMLERLVLVFRDQNLTADEQKVVAAMKAGSTMVVQGRSTRGTLTTDEYSLNGITKALEAVTKACQ